jgi:hypothetical protein
MRRHIVPIAAIDFDARVNMLLVEIRSEWEEKVKRLHRQNYEKLVADLSIELGAVNFPRKLEDFKALGHVPFSIVSYHNQFLRQSREAFVQGHYFPALTGACALGERILNHLILDLRDDFSHKKSHAKVATRASFESWQQMIHVLKDWDVLLPDAARAFERLGRMRNRSLHFNVATYTSLREDALAALLELGRVIEAQFSAMGLQPWFIEGTKGIAFIKKEYEGNPFVKAFYLKICPAVGMGYAYSGAPNGWKLFDFRDYDDRDVSDAEFCDMLNSRDLPKLAPTDYPAKPEVVCYEWK